MNRFDTAEEEGQPHNTDYTTPQINLNNLYDTLYQNPYNHINHQSNQNPNQNLNQNPNQNDYSTTTQSVYSSQTSKYYFQPISTTKSPYDFKNFGIISTSTTAQPSENTPYYFTKRSTTRNPYDFGNFGKTTPNNINFEDNINNNYLKRSYNVASYYSDSSNISKTIVNGRLS